MLSVEYGRQLLVRQRAKLRAVGIVPRVVVEDEVVELELAAVLGTNLPVQERPEGIALHQAVEQSANLLRAPHEFALDGREHQIMAMDLVERLLDGVTGLVHKQSSFCPS